MTTPQDLLIVAMDLAQPSPPVEQGDLSLALAGAEVIDLLDAQAVTIEEDRIVPSGLWKPSAGLMGDAASALVREAPYETVEDWLWRRGEGLASAYLAAMEADGEITRGRGRWIPVRTGPTEFADSPARRHAVARWASGEPVLASLAAAVRVGGGDAEYAEDAADADDAADGSGLADVAGVEGIGDEAVVAVLATVSGAVVELDSVRQRKTVEDAAFDNIWRAP
jgi:hypothetical protein